MWAENNSNSNNNSDDNGSNNRKHKGATFYFTMPVVDMSLSI
jgi:hypothetical protein